MLAAMCDFTYITLLRRERVLQLPSPFPITTAVCLSHHTLTLNLAKMLHCRPFVQQWPLLDTPPLWSRLSEEFASCFSTSRMHQRRRHRHQFGTEQGQTKHLRTHPDLSPLMAKVEDQISASPTAKQSLSNRKRPLRFPCTARGISTRSKRKLWSSPGAHPQKTSRPSLWPFALRQMSAPTCSHPQ